MAMSYTQGQLTTDLKRFGFDSADKLTIQGLATRYRHRKGKADDAEVEALNAARDRLKAWHQEGRPAFSEQESPQQFYGDRSTPAMPAQARNDDREAAYQAEQDAKFARLTAEKAALRAEILALNRLLFWRKWRRRALLPFRGMLWVFAHAAMDRNAMIVAALAFVLIWPFVQDSTLGRYVPHIPSIYAWVNNTDAVQSLRGNNGSWTSRNCRTYSLIDGRCTHYN